MKRFDLDAEQTDAILELKIYRLARLEILVIQKERLIKRKKSAKEIGAPLLKATRTSTWKMVRAENRGDPESLRRVKARRSTNHRRQHRAGDTADDFIIEEDNVVIVTRDGGVQAGRKAK